MGRCSHSQTLVGVLRYLRCPVCRGELALADRSVRCARGHAYDIARHGYLNLAGQLRHDGDSASMVAARAEFLAAGHYAFISSALAEFSRPGLVLDVGAGTGYHLAAVLSAGAASVGLALDSSRPAVRSAARAHPRAFAVRCDAWRALPVADGAARLILNVFAPRNPAEFHRVLDPGGALLVVTPAADHLRELVEALGLLQVDPAKQDRVAAGLAGRFTPAGTDPLRRRLELTHAGVAALVGMGPSAWHTDPGVLAGRIAVLPEPVEVTAAVHLTRYLPRS
ncbi:MAG TPA: methyltransferase domain-containing protein [Micromonosporaceae bacterium]|nr:methyltransferase domain-containing protein [Micromonosporaceae bacterium]